jgi:hypothetical protein
MLASVYVSERLFPLENLSLALNKTPTSQRVESIPPKLPPHSL